MNSNFKWLAHDIDNSLVLKVMYNDSEYEVFNILDVLEVTGDKLNVETANIDDLTNLLTVGMVRFCNITDSQDILDVPFRNLYKLYYNDGVLLKEMENKIVSFSDIDVFSIIDGTISNDYKIIAAVFSKPTEELDKVMRIASSFSSLNMQEQFDAMSEVTMINHRRLKEDNMKIKR